MSLPILKPGMVGINLKGKIDPFGTINTVLQGDAKAAHVWWVLPSGKIATTGAELGFIYGEEDTPSYIKRRPFFLLETVDPIPPEKLAIMQDAHNEMMGSGIKRAYGLWKFGILEALAIKNGSVDKTGFQPKTTAPAFPICSQAVGYPFWKAGIPVGKMFGKQDYTALLPQTFLEEAQAVAFMQSNGYLKSTDGKCFYLRTVQEHPFNV